MAATSTTASNSKMEHTSFQNLHMQQQAGGGVYADVPSSTVSCLFCEPPDLKQCNEAIEKLWLLSWRLSQTCSQSTCSGKPLEAVTTHVQNYKTIYIGVGEVPEATAQTRVHARRTRRAGRPEGWTGGTGREKISRELQIMDLISDPRMCCLDASTSFEAFSQNPSLKVPYSPVPPLAIHKNLVLLQLSSTHPSQKKTQKTTTLPLTLTLPSPLGSHQQYCFADRSARLKAVGTYRSTGRSGRRSGSRRWSHIGKSQLGQGGLCLCRWKLRRMRTCPEEASRVAINGWFPSEKSANRISCV